jgi:SAM-dependent methyltransferase
MINRRTLLTSATAAAAMGIASAAESKAAPDVVDVKIDPFNLTPDQKTRHPGTHFRKLASASYQDFCDGMRRRMSNEAVRHDYSAHIERYLRSKGLNSIDDTDMDYEQAFNLMIQDPVYAASTRISRSVQNLMWDRAMRAFHSESDYYLAALAAADKAGPGTLDLNPGLDMPDYTRYEIHSQPGGYVGDPFAGFVYNYALDVGFHDDFHAPGKPPSGENDHDEMYLGMAQSLTLPENGEVHRILDLGSGTGQYTTALKERFPEAEVWGVEVGAPMVRYAHYRAVQMKVGANFAHRLAEDTKFRDGYFDIVTDHILFHEVSAAAAKNIVAEAHRVLRPGGVFHHMDVVSNGDPTPPSRTVLGKAGAWANHRHNLEAWGLEYQNSDFPAVLAAAGFEVKLGPPLARAMYPGVLAIKRA